MKPVIVIPQNIRNKIQFIVNHCDLEVSGLGTVVYDKTYNGYRVTSMCLLEQEVGAAHTDLDDDAVAQALYETRDAEGELVFWWHSHVNMDTFWSSTDHATINDIGKNGLCVAIVFNKKQEMRGAILMTPKDSPQIKFDNVDIITSVSYDFDVEKLEAEIKEKVKPKTWVRTYNRPSVLGNTVNVPSSAEKELDSLRRTALDQWSRMTKLQRSEYVGWQDYFEEMCWQHYEADRMNAMDDDDDYNTGVL